MTMSGKRQRWIEEHGPCRNCGDWADPTIDHVLRSDKSDLLKRSGGGTGPIWGWPEARRNAELAKCQVLCLTCHRIKSKIENLQDAIEQFRDEYRDRRDRRARILKEDRERHAALLKKLETVIPLPTELEERIDKIRTRYTEQEVAEQEEEMQAEAAQTVADAVAEEANDPDPFGWLRDLVVSPYGE